MGHSVHAYSPRSHTPVSFLIGLAISLALLAGTASAEAASHHYCSSCTIYAWTSKVDPTAHYITLNYVHRLSGPSSGVTIGARAKYVSDGSWGSYVYSTTTEVQHGYNGTRNAWGAATNFGAGNYGFNAHVNY